MSKLDQIIASNTRDGKSRGKTSFLGNRGRILLLTLTMLLVLFVFFTQPPVRAAIETLTGQLPI